jgi:hypothetical protein
MDAPLRHWPANVYWYFAIRLMLLMYVSNGATLHQRYALCIASPPSIARDMEPMYIPDEGYVYINIRTLYVKT